MSDVAWHHFGKHLRSDGNLKEGAVADCGFVATKEWMTAEPKPFTHPHICTRCAQEKA